MESEVFLLVRYKSYSLTELYGRNQRVRDPKHLLYPYE